MSNFPLVTWQVPRPAFIANGVPVPAPSSTLPLPWGFGVSNATTGNVSTDSLAYSIRSGIFAALGLNVTAFYVYSNGTGPSASPLKVRLTSTVSPVTMVFTTLADAYVCGFDTLSVVIPVSPASVTGTVNPAGVFVPCGVSGDVRRYTTQRAAVSASTMGPLVTNVVNWGEIADLEVMASAFPVANLERWYAAIAVYANAAGRVVADPNNTLEGMLAAAAEGATFRVYREATTTGGTTAGTYQTAKMPAIVQASSARDYATPVDAPRLWDLAGCIMRSTT